MERFRNFAIGVFALFTIGSLAFATNYTVTQGSGTTFGSLVVSAVNYAQQLVCDPTTPTQCLAVDSSGVISVKQATAANLKAQVSVASGGIASGAVASGAVASGAYASGALASGSVASGAMVDLGAQADSACSTDNGSCSEIALTKRTNQNLTTLNTSVTSAIPAGTNLIGKVGIDQTTGNLTNHVSQNPYPDTATPYTATATGTTGATTATLAGAASVTTYICGFSIRANATAAATGNATVTGVITATLNFTQWTAPNASGLGVTEMIFSPCVPASGTNQSIAVVSAAPGTGGVVSVTAWGYKL